MYAGGGIEPDRRVEGPIEGFNPAKFGRSLYARQLFATFSQRFVAEGDTRIPTSGKDRRTVGPNFEVDNAMVADFKVFVGTTTLKVDEEAFAADLPYIKAMIRYEIDLSLFGVAAARHHLISADPQAQTALGLFGEAERLTELARGRNQRVGAQ